jgi:NADH:ubiquinone oxidoreductase subunit 2 (subunit N)
LYKSVGHYFIFIFTIYFILTLNSPEIVESIFNFSLTLNNSLKILKLFLILIFLVCLIICVNYAPYQKDLQFEFFYILVLSFLG